MNYMVTLDGGCPEGWHSNIFSELEGFTGANAAARTLKATLGEDAVVAIVLVDEATLPVRAVFPDVSDEGEIEFQDNGGKGEPQVCIDATDHANRAIIAISADNAERLHAWLGQWLTAVGR